MKRILAILGAGLAIIATPASASTTVTFNLTGSQLPGGNGNSWITSTTLNGVTVQARFSAFTAKKISGGYTVYESDLGRYSAGLGVIAPSSPSSISDQNGANNLHTIDNKDSYDFIVVQFDQQVILESAKLTPFKIGESTDNDSTVAFSNFTDGTGNEWKKKLAVDFSSYLGSSSFNVPGTGSPYVVDYNPLPGSVVPPPSNRVFIGASLQQFIDATSKTKKFDADYDGFKLSALVVTTYDVVPEPATWAMMIGGFGMVGAALRRRRATESVAAA